MNIRNLNEALNRLFFESIEFVDINKLKSELDKRKNIDYTIDENGDELTIHLSDNKSITVSKVKFSEESDTINIKFNETGRNFVIEETEGMDAIISAIVKVCEYALNYTTPAKEKIKLDADFTNGVSVSGGSTDFVNIKFLTPIAKEDFVSKYKEVVRICKENRIVLSGKKNIEEILNRYDEYIDNVTKYNYGVKELQEKWKAIVEEGVYTGYSDDERINEATELRWKLEKMLNRDQIISKFETMYKKVKEQAENLLFDIEDGVHHQKISF